MVFERKKEVKMDGKKDGKIERSKEGKKERQKGEKKERKLGMNETEKKKIMKEEALAWARSRYLIITEGLLYHCAPRDHEPDDLP